jgi:hypothetical protein
MVLARGVNALAAAVSRIAVNSPHAATLRAIFLTSVTCCRRLLTYLDNHKQGLATQSN